MQLYDEVVDNMLRPPSERDQCPSIEKVKSAVNLESASSGNIIETPLVGSNAAETYDYAVTSPLHSVYVGDSGGAHHRVNQSNLQRSWDPSHLVSRDDWDEWMRRFSIQLLREAPSPALRATASLAQVYPPLARELFCAAFLCVWSELTPIHQANLINALKLAFKADTSESLLQELLTLTSFMEHADQSSRGLPIETQSLSDLALRCRSYARALFYREREYMNGGSSSCVESLISINRKLDLQGKYGEGKRMKENAGYANACYHV